MTSHKSTGGVFFSRHTPHAVHRTVLLLFATFGTLTLFSTAPLFANQNETIFFSGDKGSIQTGLAEYAQTFDISTKEGQIDYLLSRLETSPDVFERNGTRYTAQEAAGFLRWKMNRPRWQGKVNSVRDFIDVICAGSVTSGKPYTIILLDKRKFELKEILENELEELDCFLTRSSPPQP